MDASQANSMLNSFDEEMEDFELEVSHREGTQLITFILGSEKYGLKILKVRELISYPEVMTRIPVKPTRVLFLLVHLFLPLAQPCPSSCQLGPQTG